MSSDQVCVGGDRPNRVKLRGWEFEYVVPWLDLIEAAADGERLHGGEP